VIYVPSFVTIGSGIQVILRFLRQQFGRLQYCYYWWEGFIKCIIEMASFGMMYVPSFIKTCEGVQAVLMVFHGNLRACNVGKNHGWDL
jgi:hypothetical protein